MESILARCHVIFIKTIVHTSAFVREEQHRLRFLDNRLLSRGYVIGSPSLSQISLKLVRSS
ncbi:unnamed protein product [Sphenostylis stenocarpa]|uniref:Uncharacterized protein n=1 Tax=Sphenostylis stenocarpa TaxID=92480 RepID=A0AA86VBY7_9FABA|nr:unnamed protein product [Sphenostylis stenocarpa]